MATLRGIRVLPINKNATRNLIEVKTIPELT